MIKRLLQISSRTIGATLLLAPLPALALAPLEGPALESAVAKYLFKRPQGLVMMSEALGRTVTAEMADDLIDEFVSTLRRSHPTGTAQFEARIQTLRQELYEARTQRAGGRKGPEPKEFDDAERMVLNTVADMGEIRLGPAAGYEGAMLEGIAPKISHYEASKAALTDRITNPDDIIKVKAEPGERAPKDLVERMQTEISEFRNKAFGCVRNAPSTANTAKYFQELKINLAVAGAVTTGSKIIQVGINHGTLVPSQFVQDLGMSLLSTGVGSVINDPRDSFLVKYVKVYTWGVYRGRLDAEIYEVTKNPAPERLAGYHDFNYNWNTDTAWVSPVTTTILDGAECLLARYQGANKALGYLKKAQNFRNAKFITRLGVSSTNAYIYYRSRDEKLGY